MIFMITYCNKNSHVTVSEKITTENSFCILVLDKYSL